MRFRIKTRALMWLVALVAVALVTPGQLRLRRERRHLARFTEFWRRGVASHEREASLCRLVDGRRPYDPESRQSEVSGQCYAMPRFAGWSEEADWHARQAAEYRGFAAEMAREERAVRGRLVLPVIFDIERTAP